MCTTIIVSDLHLGASNSRAEDFLALLDTGFDRLILNGDTVDHHHILRYREEHWRVLERLRMVARRREVILIRGNHELRDRMAASTYGPHQVLADMLDVPLREDYELHLGRRRFLVLHGDQFDTTMNLTRLGDLADVFYRGVQQCSLGLARWLKARTKRWCGVVDMVRRGAVAQAMTGGYDGVICGHTHFEEDSDQAGCRYLNTGSWVEQPCTYLRGQGDELTLCDWKGSHSLHATPLLEPRPLVALAD